MKGEILTLFLFLFFFYLALALQIDFSVFIQGSGLIWHDAEKEIKEDIQAYGMDLEDEFLVDLTNKDLILYSGVVPSGLDYLWAVPRTEKYEFHAFNLKGECDFALLVDQNGTLRREPVAQAKKYDLPLFENSKIYLLVKFDAYERCEISLKDLQQTLILGVKANKYVVSYEDIEKELFEEGACKQVFLNTDTDKKVCFSYWQTFGCEEGKSPPDCGCTIEEIINSTAEEGTMEPCLLRLYEEGKITMETLRAEKAKAEAASEPNILREIQRGINIFESREETIQTVQSFWNDISMGVVYAIIAGCSLTALFIFGRKFKRRMESPYPYHLASIPQNFEKQKKEGTIEAQEKEIPKEPEKKADGDWSLW